MSVYTTQLRWIVENGYDLGMKDYPIFDETHREELNKKIIDHYYLREIGFETVGLFKRHLNVRLNEIMPYYNELYKTIAVEYDIINTTDITETHTRDNQKTQDVTSDNSGSSSTNAKGKNVESDTPQGLLSIDNIEGNVYASNADFNVNSENLETQNTAKTSGTENTKETISINRKGFRKSPTEQIILYRKAIVNIDLQIIEELNDLFMLLWE
jgi:hypothetical protein